MPAVLSRFARGSTSNSNSTSTPRMREPIRRALIIAIADGGEEYGTLSTPHRDGREFGKLLFEQYRYTEIVTMLDEEGHPAHLVPTRDNILRQFDKFVEGLQPGDKLVFYYNGHTLQFRSDSIHEEDDMDEAILPFRHCRKGEAGRKDVILDNDIRDRLVKPLLDIGVDLNAVLDSCHSATLFDLDHYQCNNVWFPWHNKGVRDKLFSRHARVVRRNGRYLTITPRAQVEAPQTDGDGIFQLTLSMRDNASSIGTEETVQLSSTFASNVRTPERKASSDSKHSVMANIVPRGRRLLRRLTLIRPATTITPLPNITVTRASTMGISPRPGSTVKKPCRAFSLNSLKIAEWMGNVMVFFNPRSDSPESFLECDGRCRERGQQRKAKSNVITLAACQDGQQTWEGRNSPTMTQVLIAALRTDPNPVLRDLVRNIGHESHQGTTLKLHTASQNRIRRWLNGEAPLDSTEHLENINGADPQIGSMNVLGLEERWNL